MPDNDSQAAQSAVTQQRLTDIASDVKDHEGRLRVVEATVGTLRERLSYLAVISTALTLIASVIAAYIGRSP